MTPDLSDLAAKDALRRIWSADPAIFTPDPRHEASITTRLGWLRSPEAMEERIPEMEALAAEVAAEGYRHVVLVGMGGSSLAPELLVLDNTSPAAVRRVLGATQPGKTLVVVSTKSGTTIETDSFFRAFHAREGQGRAFIAITDPGTPLATLAAELGFRRTFLNPADIGGRYSALSCFGLVPAALMGVDVRRVLRSAVAEVRRSAPSHPLAEVPGMVLGASLGQLARSGRDKLTIAASPSVAAIGAWVEQLLAESTGKDGQGIVPVDGEPLGDPSCYGPDRVFLAVDVAGDDAGSHALAALQRAGHPVLRQELADVHDLGALLFRLELATAAAAVVLQINPFDEPNVSEAKEQSGALLAEHLATSRPPDLGAGALEDLDALLGKAQAGDYAAVLLYADGTASAAARLAALQQALRARTGCATTAGFGPRYLHSTGQLHKGGPGKGIFVVILAEDAAAGDPQVPGKPYTFGTLRDAQAVGDVRVLRRRGRRVLALRSGPDVDGFLDMLRMRVEGRPAR